MANTRKWKAGANALGTPASQLTTELNSLGNAAVSAASGAYDNQTNLDLYIDVWIHLASLSPAAGAFLVLYALVSIDGGTTYPPATLGILQKTPAHILATIPIDTTAATAQDIVVRNLVIPPGKIKFALENESGVALGASGNTVKISAYNEDLNG